MIEHNYFPKGTTDEFERYMQEAETCSAKEHCIQLLKQELKQSKEEEKYLKECCEKAGKELGRYSFEWDGKEKNLVVQALQLNEMYEKLKQENTELKKENENYKLYGSSTIVAPVNHTNTEYDLLYGQSMLYKSALDTIQRMVLSAWEQGKYLDGGLYNDLTNEFAKINEVLK